MKKPALILSAVLLFAAAGSTQAQGFRRNAVKDPKANMGVKVGFNSTMFFIDHFAMGGNELSHIQNNYKVGYFGAFFCRFNLKKHHFIQTEVSYNVLHGSISIPNTEEHKELLQDNALIKSTMHTVNVPLLYGYKFIDSYPYGMAFFIGPQVTYNWERYSKNEYSGFYQQGVCEKSRPFSFSGVIGLAVNVSNIFFDFRYEAGLQNTSSNVTFDTSQTPAPHNQYPIDIKRRKNILSFSAGVIF